MRTALLQDAAEQGDCEKRPGARGRAVDQTRFRRDRDSTEVRTRVIKSESSHIIADQAH